MSSSIKREEKKNTYSIKFLKLFFEKRDYVYMNIIKLRVITNVALRLTSNFSVFS